MSLLKKIGSAIWNGAKGTGKWVLRHGPVLASFGVGLGAIPALAPIAKFIPILLGGTSSAPDSDLSEPISVVITQLILLVGSIRKFWSNYQKYKAKSS